MNFKLFFENFQKKKVFHGTPYEKPIDQLSLKYIGTGQGAQTFGWGLYFAENEKVADSYRYAGDDMNKTTMSGVDHLSFDEAKKRIEDGQSVYAKDAHSDWYRIDYLDFLKRTEEFRQGPRYTSELKRRGNLYQYHLNVHDYELLDWDMPLNKHPIFIRKALMSLTKITDELSYRKFPDGGGFVVDKDGNAVADNPFPAYSQEQLDEERQKIPNLYFFIAKLVGSQKESSMWLLEKGIKGIMFYDQGSRKKAKGTRNFVIFDESIIEKINK